MSQLARTNKKKHLHIHRGYRQRLSNRKSLIFITFFSNFADISVVVILPVWNFSLTPNPSNLDSRGYNYDLNFHVTFFSSFGRSPGIFQIVGSISSPTCNPPILADSFYKLGSNELPQSLKPDQFILVRFSVLTEPILLPWANQNCSSNSQALPFVPPYYGFPLFIASNIRSSSLIIRIYDGARSSQPHQEKKR